MNKNLVFGVLVALVLALFVWKYVSVNIFGPSDQALIRRALDEAVQASREGRPGGVMDKLTDRFKVNTDEPGNRQVADFIKNSHPDITVSDEKAVVSEDTARITGPVRVRASFLGMNFDQKIDDVSLVFQRESAHEWGFIPVRKWRLDQVLVPPALAPSTLATQE